MGKPAARMTDMVMQDAPHCHAPIHPPAPTPTPVPHPALPLTIIKGQPTVLIGNMPAARLTDTTMPCMLPGCVPAGPGMIALGSATELEYHLILAHELGYVAAEPHAELTAKLTSVKRMLQRFIQHFGDDRRPSPKSQKPTARSQS